MIERFVLAVLFTIYNEIRSKIILYYKKEIDEIQFNNLKKKISTKLNHSKNKSNAKVLVASFVHQLGYIYTECLMASYISKIKNVKIIGLMDDNDNTTKKFLNCFNSVENTFLKKLSFLEKVKYLYKSYKILKKYQTVENFVKFKVGGIDIGAGVYDHYIRNSNNPSANSLNYKFIIFLSDALYVNDFCSNFFKKKKIDFMIMSEKQFLPSSIVFQNALKMKIKVVSRISGPKEISVAIYRSFDEKDDADIKIQKKFLKKFLLKNTKKYSNNGLNKLRKILGGTIRNPDYNIKYNIKKTKIKKQKFYKELGFDPKKKVCFIFSHNLLDGVYGGKSIKVFKDYLSWLRETLIFIKKLDKSVNWVVKDHPSDYGFAKMRTNTKKEFDNIIGPNNKNIKFFPKNYNVSIIKDIAACVITQGGSCGMEYPCFGIQSINSSGIFYSENNFTNDYKNKKEYFNFLKNIKKIINKKLTKKQINIARVHYYLSYDLIKFNHPLLYNFDITRKLNQRKFFAEIFSRLTKYNNKKDLFEKYFTKNLNSTNKHLINNQKL